MKSALLLLLSVAACTSNDDPTVTVSTDAQKVYVAVQRSPEHTFTTITATVNGIDAGAAVIDPGHVAASNASPFADQDSPAFATFTMPVASLTGSDAQVEITEGSDHFSIDVPELLSKRTVHVLTPNVALHANDLITIDTGVASDVLSGTFEGMVGTASCFTAWNTIVNPTSVSYQMPPDLTQDWTCSTVVQTPAPGGTLASTLAIEVWGTTPVTRCDGPGLTCAPSQFGPLNADVPVTLAF